MTLILVGQVVLSSMALARQADVDLMAYDAWDQAYKDDRGILSKFEKTVRNRWVILILVFVLWVCIAV